MTTLNVDGLPADLLAQLQQLQHGSTWIRGGPDSEEPDERSRRLDQRGLKPILQREKLKSTLISSLGPVTHRIPGM